MVTIRRLQLKDVSQNYVAWLNDDDVVKYTEQRWRKHTIDDVRDYVSRTLSSDTEFLYGIFVDGEHVGNIKLGAVSRHHKTAWISFLIGNKAFWGHGVATAAIAALIKIAFTEFDLEKLSAGTYANNTASEIALKRNGFKLEAVREKQYVFDGERIDARLFGLLRD